MSAPKLAELQEQFTYAVIGEWSRPLPLVSGGGPSVEERFRVYSDAWFWRLEESLRDDYAGLFRAMGEELWNKALRSYLLDHPSSSYTIARAGDQLPDFLRVRRHETLGLQDWHVEVAQLERALYLSRLGRDPKPWRVEELQTLPPEELENLRLHLPETAHLFHLQFNAGEWLHYESELREEPTYAIVHREGFNSVLQTLNREQYDFLSALQRSISLGGLIDLFPGEEWLTFLQEFAAICECETGTESWASVCVVP